MASILVLDDNEDLASVMEALLEAEGHEVRVAHDGEAGLRLLEDRVPDVVITDVEMPHLDGPSMAYRMFVHNCGMEQIPIILVSGAADLAAIAKRVGTPYVLAKPYSIECLIETLARALSERKAPVP